MSPGAPVAVFVSPSLPGSPCSFSASEWAAPPCPGPEVAKLPVPDLSSGPPPQPHPAPSFLCLRAPYPAHPPCSLGPLPPVAGTHGGVVMTASNFFIRRGRPFPCIPGLSGGSLRPPLRASDSHHRWPLPTAAGSCCAPCNGREDPHCSSGYRNLLDQCISHTLFELARAHLQV